MKCTLLMIMIILMLLCYSKCNADIKHWLSSIRQKAVLFCLSSYLHTRLLSSHRNQKLLRCRTHDAHGSAVKLVYKTDKAILGLASKLYLCVGDDDPKAVQGTVREIGWLLITLVCSIAV